MNMKDKDAFGESIGIRVKKDSCYSGYSAGGIFGKSDILEKQMH